MSAYLAVAYSSLILNSYTFAHTHTLKGQNRKVFVGSEGCPMRSETATPTPGTKSNRNPTR